MKRLIFATHNANKVREMNQIFRAYFGTQDFVVTGLDEIGVTEEIPETGNTFAANALQKARYTHALTGCDTFADDSGLEIDALNGTPGVYSARYAGVPSNMEKNIDLVLKQMKNCANRSARFKCVAALIINGKEHLFEGSVEGEITYERQGNGGFGYDPIFKPKAYDATFAQLDSETKNKISHRGEAIQKMLNFLNE